MPVLDPIREMQEKTQQEAENRAKRLKKLLKADDDELSDGSAFGSDDGAKRRPKKKSLNIATKNYELAHAGSTEELMSPKSLRMEQEKKTIAAHEARIQQQRKEEELMLEEG